MQLKSLTTMKIGGEPEAFIKLKDLDSIKGPLKTPVRILGNGSNILIDDIGLKGTVICARDFPPSDPEILSESSDFAEVKVSAGCFLPALCRWAEKRGFSGCEYFIGVPGTMGGAIVQNAGANDQEVSQILTRAGVFDLKNFNSFEISAADLDLTYRHSRLKEKSDWLVLWGVLKLSKLKTQNAIQDQIKRNQDYRREKTPYNKSSLGSVFTRIPDGKGGWLFPGKLIEDAGLKGKRQGDAKVSEIHANYIVNEGNATFDDVIGLIKMIEIEVERKFGVRMNREILIWSDRPY